jgi:D-sedoheptulose 7-phosphate isomerase
MNNKFFNNYFFNLHQLTNNYEIKQFNNIINKLKKIGKNNKLIIVGNGGSASIANHIAVDFTNIAGIRAITFNEPNLITCFANDYGHDNWMSQSLKKYAIKGDICILISSSGKSNNIINAAKECKKKKIYLITLSGFDFSNPLKKMGKVNLWVNSKVYNFIEMVHHVWLVSIVDYLKK